MALPLAREPGEPGPRSDLAPFVPALLRTWLTDDPTTVQRVVDGTLAMIDVSGFTQLTERLAARGRVGAEELTEILNTLFCELLELARRDGAHLVKWSGDAVLLLFTGDHHAARAARAAHRMRAGLVAHGHRAHGGRSDAGPDVGRHPQRRAHPGPRR